MPAPRGPRPQGRRPSLAARDPRAAWRSAGAGARALFALQAAEQEPWKIRPGTTAFQIKKEKHQK